MSYTITQQATSPNAAYTRLLYAVSGSIYTTQPQFQYVMDVYESGSSNLIKRTTQTINPAGVAIFDPSRIIQGQLSVDYNWKVNTPTEFNSSSKEFTVEFGEQFGVSISSSVTVYPNIASSSIETFQGVVEPNAGYYNWDSASYAVLSNMPATMSMQTNDYGTISLYDNNVSYVSQSFYSASSITGTYDLVEQKNYSITDTFSSVPISGSTPYWNYVDVSISSSIGLQEYRYEASDETTREKTRFAFINKLGAWDYYNNYNPVRQRIDISRQQYTAPRVDYSSLTSTYDISRRGKTVNNSSTDDQFTIDTNYLDQANATWLEELIESPSVYIQRNGEFIPVIITDTSYTADTNPSRQKLFKYTINFKPSNQPFGTWIPEYVQCPKQPLISGWQALGARWDSPDKLIQSQVRDEYLYLLNSSDQLYDSYYGNYNYPRAVRINTSSGDADTNYFTNGASLARPQSNNKKSTRMAVLDSTGSLAYSTNESGVCFNIANGKGELVRKVSGSLMYSLLDTPSYVYAGTLDGITKYDKTTYESSSAFATNFALGSVRDFNQGNSNGIFDMKLGSDGYIYATGTINNGAVTGSNTDNIQHVIMLKVSQSGEVSPVTSYADAYVNAKSIETFTSSSIQYAVAVGEINDSGSDVLNTACFNTTGNMTLLPGWKPSTLGLTPVSGLVVNTITADNKEGLLLTGRDTGVIRVKYDGTVDSNFTMQTSGSWIYYNNTSLYYNAVLPAGDNLINIGTLPYIDISGTTKPIQNLVITNTSGSYQGGNTGASLNSAQAVYFNNANGECGTNVTNTGYYNGSFPMTAGEEIYYTTSSVATLGNYVPNLGFNSSSNNVSPTGKVNSIVTGSIVSFGSCP